LLLLFFLAAAASAPIWAKLATRHGPRTVLLWGMILAIAAFSGAVFLGAGDVAAFALICLASGVALGADMTLLPALFAHRMEKVAPAAAGAFGLWSFVSKFTLAFAALLLLPTLQSVGFVPGATNNTEALFVLSLAYGALPCVLKLIAIALVATLKTDEIE
jgi:GPH family glycoside/pentoside/hexuronide:cation symporter